MSDEKDMAAAREIVDVTPRRITDSRWDRDRLPYSVIVCGFVVGHHATLSRARMMASKYRNRIAAALAAARAEERERCARIAETRYRREEDRVTASWTVERASNERAHGIAAEIRAGGAA